MKAAILEKINAPLGIEDVVETDYGYWPLEHGQVLVRVLVAGICGAQLQEISGHKGDPSHLPHMLGHEGCGIVEQIGPGVKHVKPGDKVVMHWRKGAGMEAALPIYSSMTPRTYNADGAPCHWSINPPNIKAGPITTFSEYSLVSANRVTPVPDDFPSDLACLLGCALSTALATIENETRWGQSILIIGCGGVGLSFVLAADLNHLRVSVTDLFDFKIELARKIAGANYDESWKDFDVIIDTTGSCLHFNYLAPGGKYIMVGQPAAIVRPELSVRMFEGDGKTIKATQGGCFSPSTDIPRYVQLFRSGALDDYSKLITHRVSLQEINRGLDLVRGGKAGRVLIDMSL